MDCQRNAVIGGRQGREEVERIMGRLGEKKADLILEERASYVDCTK